MKNCSNCAWYCHGDSQCYGNGCHEELAVEVSPDHVCKYWMSDGISDEEREELDALVTMEENVVGM